MNHPSPAGFSPQRFSPERRAFLAGHFLCADGFHAIELPDEQPDFRQTGAYLTLAAVVANDVPAVFTVAARPAYEDGTVARWLGQLCVREGLEHGRVLSCRLGDLRGVTCEFVQHTATEAMRGRLVFVEDGGRLFKLAAVAPEAAWDRLAPGFGVMLQSFQPAELHGPKCPLTAAQQRSTVPPVRPLLLTREEWDELVLAPDAASFDSGRGFSSDFALPERAATPGVLTVNDEARIAIVAAPALEGSIRVPFGWRVVDDGTRVLVFDEQGSVRIVLEEHAHGGRTLHQLADDFVGGAFGARRLRASTALLFDDIVGVEVQCGPDESPALDRACLLRDIGRPGCVLVATIEAGRRAMRPARNLAGEILAGFESVHAAAAN